MSDITIEIKNLSKVYKLYDKPIDRMKEALSIRKKRYSQEHYALNNLSLEIKKGETIGIIGTNGSGKSTLLKIITGILTPSSGTINVNGKISALLELGAGFNPEYTGLENIYLNGMMLGYSKEEMQAKEQSIIEFADIGEFIHQPVKTYSSGMFARLAFAVSINVEPEILIVDEALSVGDTKFQMKCIEKMKQLKSSGITILFVSHALEQIKRFCDKTLWLNQGNFITFDQTDIVLDQYEEYTLYGTINTSLSNKTKDIEDKLTITKTYEDEVLIESIPAKIKKLSINKDVFSSFEELVVLLEYEIYLEKIPNFLAGVAIYTPDRKYIFGPNTYLDKVDIPNTKGYHKLQYKIPSITLLNGQFVIDAGIFSDEGLVCIDYKSDEYTFHVTNPYFAEGDFFIEHTWEVLQ